MLTEVPNARQIKGESKRRWFSDDYFDLIIWLDETDEIVGFQLCYDKYGNERALTWRKQVGYVHERVDDGEHRPGKMKATPILVLDGQFEHEKIASVFKEESSEIEERISKLVYEKISECQPHAGQV